MHGWQWQSQQHVPAPQSWQDYYQPAVRNVPFSEQQTWNVHSIGSALGLARERIREQDEEIQQLRDMFQNGTRMNAYLVEEVEQLKEQLRQARGDNGGMQQAPVAWTSAQDDRSWSQASRRESFASADNEPRSQTSRRESFPSVAFSIPSPRSLPTPFDSGEGGSNLELGEEIPEEDLPEDVPTRGSLRHPDNCKPCFYIFNKKGCHFGRSCLYCHMNHVRRKKERPPKSVRQECREIANKVFREAAPTAASNGASSSSHLEDALRSRAELARASHVTTNYAASVLRALERRTEDAEGRRSEGEREADNA